MSRCQLPDSWHSPYQESDVEALKLAILRNLEYRLARDLHHATAYDLFLSTAYAASEYLAERWILTKQSYFAVKPKRVYYLSMEFLMGRSLTNSLINIGLYDIAKAALHELNVELDDLEECEADAGLGNGGLGRLAACFLDSMATIGLPAHGYGIRYDFGLFHQKIINGRQVESPDQWLALPNPWEVMRPRNTYSVQLGGHVEHQPGDDGKAPSTWVHGDEIYAVAYDTPVPGYHTETVNTLRLWTARSSEEFNLDFFNNGDYVQACEKKVLSENITKVLYPNDERLHGKALRLKQEYFLVSASLQDIIRRFEHDHDSDWTLLPEKVAIQLNDTHPALAIPELMRILIDEKGLSWSEAWPLTVCTFAYTNHTLMGEALELWPVSLLRALLPRHLEIICLINHYFLKDVARRYPGDVGRLGRMSIILEGDEQQVRMAYLAVVGSHKVNGVATLHSRLMQETIFRDFADFWPERFTNKTNGITPRRWLLKSNPCLAGLITEAIGDTWITDLSQLRALEPFSEDAAFRARWRDVKAGNKVEMAARIAHETGVIVDPASMFDIQVKRIHEYKRQHLFALQIIASYLHIKANPAMEVVQRTCLFGGKAAPGYVAAKRIIHLLTRIADMINRDEDVAGRLRVAFLPNYRVSLAERLIPAADLSEQISTAGLEASGTGNMKFALNGALTIGTLDGANIEIREEVGEENIFIFGHTAAEVRKLKEDGYQPGDYITRSPELAGVLDLLRSNFFSPSEPGLFADLYNELLYDDHFMLLADFDQYLACHTAAEEAYRDQERWTRMSILNVARSGKFSSDRTIRDYAEEIWDAHPVCVPADDAVLPHHLLATL